MADSKADTLLAQLLGSSLQTATIRLLLLAIVASALLALLVELVK